MVLASLAIIVLECKYFPDPARAFAKAKELYANGSLELSQSKAAQGYARFKYRDAFWASNFHLLEAETLASRGFSREALVIFDDTSIRPIDIDKEESFEGKAIQAFAYMQIGNYGEAKAILAEASAECAHTAYVNCSQILIDYGELASEQGRLAEAGEYYQKALVYARSHHDGKTERISLLDLGYVALQTDRFDDALTWLNQAYMAGVKYKNRNTVQGALGNLGIAYLGLGDVARARKLFQQAKDEAAILGNTRDEVKWLKAIAAADWEYEYLEQARSALNQAMSIAERIHDQQDVRDSLEDLLHISIEMRDFSAATSYLARVKPLVMANVNELDKAYVELAEGKLAASQRQFSQAEQLFKEVDSDAESQMSMRVDAEHEISKLYESEGQVSAAQSMYGKTLTTFEAARDRLKEEDSKLPFEATAVGIYDDYVHFLLKQGKVDEALLAADQSRARTLAQGLGADGGDAGLNKVDLDKAGIAPVAMAPEAVARKVNATLLFYWLGEKQSYLWVVTRGGTKIFPLAPKAEIEQRIERYRRALMGPEDPIASGNADGRALYGALIEPAAGLIDAELSKKLPVMVLADGALCQLNFATLIAPASERVHAEHYWIEDATVISAPSLAMLAAGKAAKSAKGGRLLLMGDAVSPDPNYPQLEYAGTEMEEIEKHFPAGERVVFARERAVPEAYLKSEPGKFAFIHFVSHGVASQTDPLDSAIILSKGGLSKGGLSKGVLSKGGVAKDGSSKERSSREVVDDRLSQDGVSRGGEVGSSREGFAGGDGGGVSEDDSFKLYAREIMKHPIDARLVTISACYGNGTRVYVGEGLVGLSWAFLHAGAHNAIGALWEASDRSTAMLMDSLYGGLAEGEAAGVALRNAQLALLHSKTSFRKPFYWAPFQIYTRM